MNAVVDDLLQRIRTMEDELEMQLALARADLHVHAEDGKIAFEQAVQRRHRAILSTASRKCGGAITGSSTGAILAI